MVIGTCAGTINVEFEAEVLFIMKDKEGDGDVSHITSGHKLLRKVDVRSKYHVQKQRKGSI